MEAIEALHKANDEFTSRLRTVAADDWGRSTPCPEWDVHALVNHMLLGTRMSIQVLQGMPREDIIAALDDNMLDGNDDPVGSFTELADEMVALFAAPGGLEGVVAHPAGDFPRQVFVGFRIGDAAIHAWDLARAIDGETALDVDLVQYLWDDVQPRRDMLAASGMFGDGASGNVADDAPLQQRYLDLMGRRP